MPYFQVPVIVEGLFERLGYSDRRKLVKSILDQDAKGLKETSTRSFSSYERVTELGLGRFVRQQLDSGGEQRKSSEEEEEGFY